MIRVYIKPRLVMSRKSFCNLATVFLVGCAYPGLGLAQTSHSAIPAYTFRDGTYPPNEPWREGQPRITGLQQPWPRMKSVEENPITPEKVSLGKLLYFDPILSGENTISCAHCHHP